MEDLFGKRVRFTHELQRHKTGTERKWLRMSKQFIFPYSIHNAAFREGIIIGVRTLWDGKIHYESVDSGYCKVFIFGEPVKAYLVATDLKTNPIYVLQSDIIEIKP